MAIEIEIKGCHCLGIHLQHTFACLSPIVVPKFLLYDLVFLAESNTQEIALGCLVRTSLSIIAACEDGLVKRTCRLKDLITGEVCNVVPVAERFTTIPLHKCKF